MYEYLDEESRRLLFNQEDYNILSEKLNSIEEEALRLQSEYEESLSGATLETVESITSEYQMQYETLMKSYEIAKADLEVAKKKSKLNNVLNERNVRMFIDGQWRWVANTEDVVKAKSELADAEYAKRVEEAGLTQQKSINELTNRQNALTVVINKFESGVIDLDTAVSLAKNAIGSIPGALSKLYNTALTDGAPAIEPSELAEQDIEKKFKDIDFMNLIYEALDNADLESALAYNVARNKKIKQLGLNTPVLYEDDIIHMFESGHRYSIVNGLPVYAHADGTKYTPGGLTLMGENEPELYINQNGHLIPINRPTISNIGAGGVVFNQEQMKGIRNLWDLSNLTSLSSKNILQQPTANITKTIDNRIIINGMTVDGGSTDGQNLINALKRYVTVH